MKKIKSYDDFMKESVKESVNETFTITVDQLPKIGDIVDKVDWKAGDTMAFIDFKGIKNIPVKITKDVEEVETEKV
jgi:hypothetical protein